MTGPQGKFKTSLCMCGRVLNVRVFGCLVCEMPWGLTLNTGVEDRDRIGTQGLELDIHRMETL